MAGLRKATFLFVLQFSLPFQRCHNIYWGPTPTTPMHRRCCQGMHGTSRNADCVQRPPPLPLPLPLPLPPSDPRVSPHSWCEGRQPETNKQTNKAASKQASQEASNRYCRSQHSTLSFQPPCVCAIGERHGTDNALREGGRGELPDDGCGGVVTVYRKRSRRAVAKQRGHNVANQESRNHDVCMPSKQRKRSCTVLPYCTVRVY